jgi:hypothetical protein
MKLSEGLRRGDLEDLVLPMISVDEYVSKVSDEAIVFGFYVNEKGAAEDLNRFIQRSPLDLLDTDISNAPDQHGFYMVFVELINNEFIGETFESLLGDISELTGVDKWQMHVRDYEHLITFTPDSLMRVLGHDEETESKEDDDSEEKKDESVTEGFTPVLEYLIRSDLHDASLDGDVLTLKGRNTALNFVIEGFGPSHDVTLHVETHATPDMSLCNTARLNRIARILGEGWVASSVGRLDVIQRADDEMVVLLRPIL